MGIRVFPFLLFCAVSADHHVVHCHLEKGLGIWYYGAALFCIVASSLAVVYSGVFFGVEAKEYSTDTAVALRGGFSRHVRALGISRRIFIQSAASVEGIAGKK